MTGQAREVKLHYGGRSEVQSDERGSRVLLALDRTRGAVGVRGTIAAPAFFRDALLTAVDVLGSDLRHKRKDRAAYLAYLAKQGKKATQEIWQAQKAYLDEQLDGEEKPRAVLEPLFTVHPDEVSLEVFSRDESSYARLSLASPLFLERQAAHGTTCADLSPELVQRLERLRSWQPISLDASTEVQGAAREESISVPPGWLRGLLQVQSAATLPAVTAELAPIDAYNLLFALRMRRARTAPRALRFELVPGSRPRMVLEPWELVLECHGPRYQGKSARVIRTFGRQRLLALARALPHARSVKVHLMGGGLPHFWVVDFGEDRGHLTMALTGWTESGWSSAAAFDALTPPLSAAAAGDRVRALLDARGPSTFEEVAAGLEADPAAARAALQAASLRGLVVFDLATRRYRPRSLLAEPVSLEAIRYGSDREAQAHRLLGDGREGEGKVAITRVHEIAGEGTELTGQVEDTVARRSYTPSFTLDGEGRVSGASCQCPAFRRAGLREGPCEHMIALRLLHARERVRTEALRRTPEGRRLIRAETRTLVRRDGLGPETVYRVTLDDKSVVLRWGPRSGEPRRQQLWFDTDQAAREAYFARLEALAAQRFIDAEAVD